MGQDGSGGGADEEQGDEEAIGSNPQLPSRDQSNLVPSYVSGNYYGYYIQLGVRGYLGLKVLRLGWERFKKCIVYMAQDLCGYYTRII